MATVDILREQLSFAHAELQRSRDYANGLHPMFDKLKANVAELEKTVAIQAAEKAQLKIELSAVEQELKTSREATDTLRKELVIARERLENVRKHRNEINASATRVNEQLKTTLAQLEELRAQPKKRKTQMPTRRSDRGQKPCARLTYDSFGNSVVTTLVETGEDL